MQQQSSPIAKRLKSLSPLPPRRPPLETITTPPPPPPPSRRKRLLRSSPMVVRRRHPQEQECPNANAGQHDEKRMQIPKSPLKVLSLEKNQTNPEQRTEETEEPIRNNNKNRKLIVHPSPTLRRKRRRVLLSLFSEAAAETPNALVEKDHGNGTDWTQTSEGMTTLSLSSSSDNLAFPILLPPRQRNDQTMTARNPVNNNGGHDDDDDDDDDDDKNDTADLVFGEREFPQRINSFQCTDETSAVDEYIVPSPRAVQWSDNADEVSDDVVCPNNQKKRRRRFAIFLSRKSKVPRKSCAVVESRRQRQQQPNKKKRSKRSKRNRPPQPLFIVRRHLNRPCIGFVRAFSTCLERQLECYLFANWWNPSCGILLAVVEDPWVLFYLILAVTYWMALYRAILRPPLSRLWTEKVQPVWTQCKNQWQRVNMGLDRQRLMFGLALLLLPARRRQRMWVMWKNYHDKHILGRRQRRRKHLQYAIPHRKSLVENPPPHAGSKGVWWRILIGW